jgi:hypothetical protein
LTNKRIYGVPPRTVFQRQSPVFKSHVTA